MFHSFQLTSNWGPKCKRHRLEGKQNTNTMGHLVSSYNVASQDRSQKHIAPFEEAKNCGVDNKARVRS